MLTLGYIVFYNMIKSSIFECLLEILFRYWTHGVLLFFGACLMADICIRVYYEELNICVNLLCQR